MTDENDGEAFQDCDSYLQKYLGGECSCEVSFELDHDFQVYFVKIISGIQKFKETNCKFCLTNKYFPI